MPSWAIHLAVATKLEPKINYNKTNKNIFLLGNVLPDILNGHVIKNISHIVPHKQAHFEKEVQIGNHKEYRYDIQGFYETYKNQFDNPLIFGYYTHLLTDLYWNDLTYGQKGIFDDEKNLIGLQLNNGQQLLNTKDELRRTKTNDFKLFSNYIYINKIADIPEYDEKMLEYAKDVTWLDLQEEDIVETITYLDGMATLKNKIDIEEPDYRVFSEKEMMEHLEKCVNFIEDTIRKNQAGM